VAKIKTPYARVLSESFDSKERQGKKIIDHLILRDDLIPIFMLNPGSFTSERKDNIALNFLKDESAGSMALEMIIRACPKVT